MSTRGPPILVFDIPTQDAWQNGGKSTTPETGTAHEAAIRHYPSSSCARLPQLCSRRVFPRPEVELSRRVFIKRSDANDSAARPGASHSLYPRRLWGADYSPSRYTRKRCRQRESIGVQQRNRCDLSHLLYQSQS